MIDLDGSFDYTPIRKISLQDNLHQIKLYPNPTNGSFTIDFSGNTPNDLLISDISGRTILKRYLSPDQKNNKGQISTPGMYIVQLIQDGEVVWRERLVVE